MLLFTRLAPAELYQPPHDAVSSATMAPVPSSVTCMRLRTTNAAEGRAWVSTVSAIAVAEVAARSVSARTAKKTSGYSS